MSTAEAAIDRNRALAIQQRAMCDWIAMLGGAAPDSRLGESVYTALGYRGYFRLHLYERRKPA
jgi:hypothetical protein